MVYIILSAYTYTCDNGESIIQNRLNKIKWNISEINFGISVKIVHPFPSSKCLNNLFI